MSDERPRLEILPPGAPRASEADADGGPKPLGELVLKPEFTATPAPATTSEKKLAAARKVDSRIRKRAERLVEMELLGAEIEDDFIERDDETGAVLGRKPPPKPAGWTEKQFRVARDARRPNKERPGYLTTAANIHKAYMQIDAAKGTSDAPPLNVNVAAATVHIHQYGAQNYPVKELKDHE